MGAMLAIAGPVLSGGSALASMFGGKNSGTASGVQIPQQWQLPQMGQLPQQWQMPGMNPAAGGAFEGIGSLPNFNYNQGPGALPAYSQTVDQMRGNPWADQGIAQTNYASGQAQNVGNSAINQGYALGDAGRSLIPYMTPLLNTAFDPQNALYGRTQQQTQDQTRAGLEARGLNSSPYGAGVEGKVMSDFNIDWQNNMLQRQLSGASGASGLLGAGGSAMTSGANLGQSGVNMLQGSAMMPYMAYNQIGSDRMTALDRLINAGNVTQNAALQIPNQQISNYLQYLGVGNQAGGVANQAGQLMLNQGQLGLNQGQLGLNQSQLGFNQNQVLGQNLGSSMAGLGKALNTMSGSGWGSSGSSGSMTGWG